MSRRVRALLLNPTTVTVAVLALATLLWNVYVAYHDDGILEGRVVGADGKPRAAVTVALYKQELIGLEQVAHTRTSADGRFQFAGHGQHRPILVIEGEDGKRLTSVPVRLMFRNQDRVLDEPLHLPAGAG